MEKRRVNYEKMYYGFPIFLLSYYDKEGNPNITTLSSSYTLRDMMVIGISSKGHTIKQLQEGSDFVINVADKKLLREIKYCGSVSGADENKFDGSKLTPIASDVVNAPYIKECPISIECTVTEILNNPQFELSTNIVAKIKGRLVCKEYLDADDRLKIEEFDNVNYFSDGIKKGFRYLD